MGAMSRIRPRPASAVLVAVVVAVLVFALGDRCDGAGADPTTMALPENASDVELLDAEPEWQRLERTAWSFAKRAAWLPHTLEPEDLLRHVELNPDDQPIPAALRRELRAILDHHRPGLRELAEGLAAVQSAEFDEAVKQGRASHRIEDPFVEHRHDRLVISVPLRSGGITSIDLATNESTFVDRRLLGATARGRALFAIAAAELCGQITAWCTRHGILADAEAVEMLAACVQQCQRRLATG